MVKPKFKKILSTPLSIRYLDLYHGSHCSDQAILPRPLFHVEHRPRSKRSMMLKLKLTKNVKKQNDRASFVLLSLNTLTWPTRT